MRFQNHINNFDKELILKLNKEGNNIKDIAKIINIPSRRLGEMIKYFGLDINSNFIIPMNHEYFDNIDTEAKAYLLGYTIADGNVTETRRRPTGSLCYRLSFLSSIDDKEVIDLLQSEISPRAIISNEINTKGAINRKPQLRIRFSSTKLVKCLIDKYDIIPNKTVNGGSFKLPIIDPLLMNHLIRGIFDGDGHVGKTLQFSLNSKFLCQDIVNELIKSIPNMTYRINEIQGKTCKYYSLYINLGKKKETKIKLGEYLYKNATHYLTRKKIKF